MYRTLSKLAALHLLISIPAADAASGPLDIASYFVTPEQESVLRWTVEPGASPEYSIRDYWGKSIASGRAKVLPANIAEATVRLARECPDHAHRFTVGPEADED